eukprot:6288601-Prymnesium_polylepis.1
MARVCGGGDVAGEEPCGCGARCARPSSNALRATRMAHCAGPGARKAAQAQAAERQACPCAEGARAGTPGRPS